MTAFGIVIAMDGMCTAVLLNECEFTFTLFIEIVLDLQNGLFLRLAAATFRMSLRTYSTSPSSCFCKAKTSAICKYAKYTNKLFDSHI